MGHALTRESITHALSSRRSRDLLTVWAILFLTSGQGFRYLLGMPIYIGLAILTIVAVVVAFRPTLWSLRPPLLIAAFVGLATASTLWSVARGVTLLASIVMIATTVIAVVTVRGTSNRRFMVLLYRSLQISLALGIIFELVVATVVRDRLTPLVSDLIDAGQVDTEATPIIWSEGWLFEGGPIQGFVGNRNPFGMIALLTGILAFVLLLEGVLSKTDAIVTLVAAIGVHALTMSATVSVAVLVVIGLLAASFVIRRTVGRTKRILSFSFLAISAIGVVLVLKYRDEIFAMFDRRSDFTNRTFIWEEVVHYATQRPEGWGFVGYWPVWQEPYSDIVVSVNEQSHWPTLPTHAHNAFLDAWFQLGLIGLGLLLVIVVLMFGSAWRLVERAERGDTYIPLGWALLGAVIAVQSLTESRMLVESGWYLLVALYLMAPQVFTLTIVDPNLVHHGRPLETRPHRVTEQRAERDSSHAS